ncbi:hypothetical protein ONZ45_g19383 [Pleurotus djamor]|nr:hypothetical protein ONZ45_g19383 [Pleurotus djamor]
MTGLNWTLLDLYGRCWLGFCGTKSPAWSSDNPVVQWIPSWSPVGYVGDQEVLEKYQGVVAYPQAFMMSAAHLYDVAKAVRGAGAAMERVQKGIDELRKGKVQGAQPAGNHRAVTVLELRNLASETNVITNFLLAAWALNRFLRGEVGFPQSDRRSEDLTQTSGDGDPDPIAGLGLEKLNACARNLFIPLHLALTLSPLALLSRRTLCQKSIVRGTMVLAWRRTTPSKPGMLRVLEATAWSCIVGLAKSKGDMIGEIEGCISLLQKQIAILGLPKGEASAQFFRRQFSRNAPVAILEAPVNLDVTAGAAHAEKRMAISAFGGDVEAPVDDDGRSDDEGDESRVESLLLHESDLGQRDEMNGDDASPQTGVIDNGDHAAPEHRADLVKRAAMAQATPRAELTAMEVVCEQRVELLSGIEPAVPSADEEVLGFSGIGEESEGRGNRMDSPQNEVLGMDVDGNAGRPNASKVSLEASHGALLETGEAFSDRPDSQPATKNRGELAPPETPIAVLVDEGRSQALMDPDRTLVEDGESPLQRRKRKTSDCTQIETYSPTLGKKQRMNVSSSPSELLKLGDGVSNDRWDDSNRDRSNCKGYEGGSKVIEGENADASVDGQSETDNDEADQLESTDGPTQEELEETKQRGTRSTKDANGSTKRGRRRITSKRVLSETPEVEDGDNRLPSMDSYQRDVVKPSAFPREIHTEDGQSWAKSVGFEKASDGAEFFRRALERSKVENRRGADVSDVLREKFFVRLSYQSYVAAKRTGTLTKLLTEKGALRKNVILTDVPSSAETFKQALVSLGRPLDREFEFNGNHRLS